MLRFAVAFCYASRGNNLVTDLKPLLYTCLRIVSQVFKPEREPHCNANNDT